MSFNGKVRWFDSKKGYGFITGENGVDTFVHFSSILQESGYRTLEEGAQVSYDVVDGVKGPSAANVVKVSTSDPVTP